MTESKDFLEALVNEFDYYGLGCKTDRTKLRSLEDDDVIAELDYVFPDDDESQESIGIVVIDCGHGMDPLLYDSETFVEDLYDQVTFALAH